MQNTDHFHWLPMLWQLWPETEGFRTGYSIDVGKSLFLSEDWLVIKVEHPPGNETPICTVKTTHLPFVSEVEVPDGEGWMRASLPLTIQDGEKFRIAQERIFEFEAMKVQDRKRP